MADDAPLGSPSRPAYLDPLTEIVGFSGVGKGRYVVLHYTIWRRMVSGAAMAGFLNPGAPEDAILAYALGHPEGDHIVETLISYSFSYAWPFQGSTYPAPPPYDIADPNQAHANVAGSVTGTPPVPGVSGFGAGLICTFLSGYFGSTPSQNNHKPALRGRSSGSPGGEPSGSGVPKPPSFGARTNGWGSLAVDVQLYDPDSGALAASFTHNFSGLTVTSGDKTYEAYRAAVVPKEEDGVHRVPPFTGTVTSANNNFNRVQIWVLCRKRTA